VIAGVMGPTAGDERAIGCALGGHVEIGGTRQLRLATDLGGQLSEQGGTWCVAEGALFNRRELDAELGLARSAGLAQMFIAGHQRWGPAMLKRLRGIFAFALWQPDSARALIATDHFALHPWYMRLRGTELVASTRFPAILKLLPRTPDPDGDHALTWLSSVWRDGASTFAAGVQRLRGGHALRLAGGVWQEKPYWDPVFEPPLRGQREELASELRRALGVAIRSRIPGGVTTGVMLSGGFDSSAVTGVAATELAGRGDLLTYSAGFPGDAVLDESGRVEALVQARGLHNKRLHLQPQGILRQTASFQRDHGFPCSGPGYALERPLLEIAAGDGVGILLDGMGGDEVFGVAPFLLGDLARRGHVVASLRMLRRFPDLPASASRGVLQMLAREYIAHGVAPHGLERRLRARGGHARHAPDWIDRRHADRLFEIYDPWAWKLKGHGPLWWRHLRDLLTSHRDSSGLAEYVGVRGHDLPLEARPPLLDVELVELALRLPPEFRFGGMNRAFARESVKDDIPPAVRLAQRKTSLRPFYHRALAGRDLPALRWLLNAPDARVSQWVPARRIGHLLDRVPAVGEPGWKDWLLPVWPLLTAEIALRTLENPAFPEQFLDRTKPPAPLFEVRG